MKSGNVHQRLTQPREFGDLFPPRISRRDEIYQSGLVRGGLVPFRVPAARLVREIAVARSIRRRLSAAAVRP